jgi:hypothetical protein
MQEKELTTVKRYKAYEDGYRVLAGPYDVTDPKEGKMLKNILRDLEGRDSVVVYVDEFRVDVYVKPL